MIAMCTLATNTNQRGKNVLDCVICLRSYRNHLRPKGGMSCYAPHSTENGANDVRVEGEALDGVNADLYDEAADPI